MTNKRRKVCYVVCYKDPNYTRTNSLVNALQTLPDVDLVVVKNAHKGLMRYLEVPLKLFWTRLKHHPDVFVVGFRAHEIFWAFYPSMVGKRIIFDEFIDHHDWIVNEHNKFGFLSNVVVSVLDAYMKGVMRLSRYVLTDTDAHAALCVENYGISAAKVKAIPVGADESLFFPRSYKASKKGPLTVLYYGSMLPLHGIDVVLEAMREVTEHQKSAEVTLTVVGGDQAFKERLEIFIAEHSLKKSITHLSWVELNRLPDFISTFDLCLGGPFGNTGQAQRVITGKTYQMLAMGKPAVVGKIEGLEGFHDKYNCLLVDQGSAEKLAEVFKWALANRQKLPAIGEKGRQLFETEFAASSIATLLEPLLND